MSTLFDTLPRYMMRHFLYNFLFLLGLLLFIVYIFEMIELLRRIGNRDISFMAVVYLTFLKLPEVGQIVLPFAVLFSAMYSFWRLNRTSELTVMRAMGMSALHFTTPMLFVALFLGILSTTVINPVSSVLLGKFERMEDDLYQRTSNLVSITRSGLWLRQNTDDGYALLNARRLNPDEWRLDNVLLLRFDSQNQLTQRIQAQNGYLQSGQWALENVMIFENRPRPETIDEYILPTDLTPQDIIDTFASVGEISFWKVRDFIQTLHDTGFSTTRMEVYYQSLLVKPFLFMAMVLLAAAVSLRPQRQGGTVIMVVSGIFIGFFLFFSDSVLQALGISQKIPVFFAAWIPTILSILLGGAMLLHQEDG